MQTEVNPDRSIVATFQVLRGASFVTNDAAQARDARSPPTPAELKWLCAGRTFEGEFSKITRSYAERNPLRNECQPQVQRVLACRQSTVRESVPTIAFRSADDVSSDRIGTIRGAAFSR